MVELLGKSLEENNVPSRQPEGHKNKPLRANAIPTMASNM